MERETSPDLQLDTSPEAELTETKCEENGSVMTTENGNTEETPVPQRAVESDPSSYTFRDLLLLTQILHTLGLIEPEQLRSSKLDEYAEGWFHHKCTVLSRRQGQFPLSDAPSGEQILQLYENMLIDYSPCKDTTELANCFYHLRIKDLESKLADEKAQFETLHNLA